MNIRNIKNLLVSYFIENWRRDLLKSWIVVFLISALLSWAPFVILAVVVALIILWPSQILANATNVSARINYLMIPAGTAEKIVANMLIANVYSVIAIVFSAWAGYTAAYLFTTYCLHIDNLGSYLSGFDFQRLGCSILTIYVFISIFFFGSIYFRKNRTVTTILWLLIVSIVLFVIYYSIVYLNLKIINPADPFYLNIQTTQTIAHYNAGVIANNIAEAATIIYFYFLSFLRLRETEA